MNKRIVSVLLALVLALASCAGLAEAVGSGSLSFTSDEPITLNMIQANSNLDANVYYLISAMLYRPYDGDVYPELAEGYTVNEDNTLYTYTIKEAYYTDGTPITAADFVYYLVSTLDSATAVYYKNGAAYLNGECAAEDVGIKVVDDKTFTVELEQAISDFDPRLEAYPINQAYAESKGEALGGTPADLMYSGPYVLTEWVYGSYLTFEKNPSYIAAADSFPIANLKLIVNTDANARYAMFTTGEADVLTVAGETEYELMPDACTHYLFGSVQGLEFNTTGMYFDGSTFAPRDEKVTALLANKNFRMALSYAINRELLVAVVNPTGQATNRLISPDSNGNSDDTTFVADYPVDTVPMSGDAEKAKEYLALALSELGYSSVSELPTIKYLTFDATTYKLMAETLQSEWKNVLGLTNIEIELKPVQDAVMSMVFMDYDMYYQSLGAEVDNPRLFLEYWITGGSVSDVMQAGAPFSSIYSNAEFDALVEEAKYEFDRTARNAMIAKAEQIMLDDFIYVPIQLDGGYYVVSDRVQGFVMNGTQDGFMFNNTTIAE